MTSTERARLFKARQAKDGLVQMNVWVPAGASADFARAAELIRANPDLRLARLMSVKTGRLRGLG